MSTSIANNSIALGTSSGFSDRMARNIIHKLLTGLSHGRFVVRIDQGENVCDG